MNERENSTEPTVAPEDQSLLRETIEEKMCRGLWRIKPDVLLRMEDDCGILFDPDADALIVLNPIGTALLRWRRDRISYPEWCTALHAYYGEQPDLPQIRADLRKFLGQIFRFVEPCAGAAHDDGAAAESTAA